MPLTPVLPKQQLLEEVSKLLADPYRGISKVLFAEICGVSVDTLRLVFEKRENPMTEMVQIRVNRGYAEWKAGNVRIMKRPDNTRYVEYRKTPQPVFMSHMGVSLSKNGPKLSIKPKNRHDYNDNGVFYQLGAKK